LYVSRRAGENIMLEITVDSRFVSYVCSCIFYLIGVSHVKHLISFSICILKCCTCETLNYTFFKIILL